MKKLLLLTALTFLLLPAHAQTNEPPPAKPVIHPADTDPNTDNPAIVNFGPAPKALPSVPAWQWWPKAPDKWLPTHQNLVNKSKAGGIDIAFFGDSITQGWSGNGKAAWDRDFAPLKAGNYGIGGDTTRQILWRINHGELDGITPKLIVLAIGTNNLYENESGGTDAQIVEGKKADIDLILSKLPHTKILIVAILPRKDKAYIERIRHINSLTAALANGTTIKFVDPSAPFLATPDTLKTELFVDLTHLTPPGYEAFAGILKPAVDDMLK